MRYKIMMEINEKNPLPQINRIHRKQQLSNIGNQQQRTMVPEIRQKEKKWDEL